ncbi:MAG: hypothetical protein ACR2LV_00325 [Solirubrobacteraceae bacterium]
MRCAPADPEPEQIQFRAITLAPRNGVRVTQARAAQAQAQAAEEVDADDLPTRC